MPVVSVVVIGYNDAAHLATAVRSATGQTLRDLEVVVVDDASTDETPQLLASLAAADPRVKPVRLDVNSGGCSRPRNVGVEHATGRYVTFLDSDDVLHRNACERLLSAATGADADMACGRYVRRHHHPRRYLAAHDELYLRPAVLASILDRPAQLRDTPACSKLYRREFLRAVGLSFPEGLLFEDLLFTTQAYCTARRIAIVPDLVYVWNVRRASATPSITNRRELRNWADRFEVHRRIDAFLARRDSPPALRAAKDRKFLDVDFTWFLRQLREFPPADRPALLDLARDYLGDVDLTAQADAVVGARVGAFLAACGDLERTLTAADYVATGHVGTDLTVDARRLYWTGSHLDTDAGRAALDVTRTGLLDAGFAATPYLVTVRTVTHDPAAAAGAREGGSLRLTGVVHDVLGRLGDPTTLSVSLAVSGRLGGEVVRVPARVRAADPGAQWEADLDLAAVGRRMRPTVGHELRLHLLLRRGGEQARLAVTARDATLPRAPVPLPSPWRRLLGGRAQVVEANGRLVLALTDLPAYVDRVIDAASLVRYVGRRAWARRQH